MPYFRGFTPERRAVMGNISIAAGGKAFGVSILVLFLILAIYTFAVSEVTKRKNQPRW
jgi:hypothetical protein